MSKKETEKKNEKVKEKINCKSKESTATKKEAKETIKEKSDKTTNKRDPLDLNFLQKDMEKMLESFSESMGMTSESLKKVFENCINNNSKTEDEEKQEIKITVNDSDNKEEDDKKDDSSKWLPLFMYLLNTNTSTLNKIIPVILMTFGNYSVSEPLKELLPFLLMNSNSNSDYTSSDLKDSCSNLSPDIIKPDIKNDENVVEKNDLFNLLENKLNKIITSLEIIGSRSRSSHRCW